MEGGGKVTVTRALATNPLQLGALGVQIVAFGYFGRFTPFRLLVVHEEPPCEE